MQLPVSTYDNEDPSSTARLINCYVEQQPPDARGPVVLRRCPGLKQQESELIVAWFGGASALFEHPDSKELILFVDQISGARGESIPEQGTAANEFLGDLVSGEYWDWAKDADSVVVTAGGQAFRMTWSGGGSYTSTLINDADFTARGAEDVEFLDNYFLFREPQTGRFFGSDVGAPTSYTSTSFATAEAAGDELVGMKATRANLLLFGEETIEIWDAVGGGAFPFRRIINGAIDKGCANGRTVAEINDQVLWVADDKTVRILQGMDPVKVSNHAIDRYLASATISSGRGFTYSFAGHDYYVLRMNDRCYVYDLTTGQWHERQTTGMESWAWGVAEKAYGKTWFSRVANPPVYHSHQVINAAYMAEDCYFELEKYGSLTMDDVPMNMSWTYQPVWGSGQRIFHDRLEIVVQTGVGNSDETDPVVNLEASDDGGQTWQALPSRAMGAAGKTFQRVVWHNLGAAYQRVYRASVSDPVPVRVMSTELTVRGGRK